MDTTIQTQRIEKIKDGLYDTENSINDHWKNKDDSDEQITKNREALEYMRVKARQKVTEELTGENKKKYTNQEQRETATYEILRSDPEYISLQQKIKDLELESKKSERLLSVLKYRFRRLERYVDLEILLKN